MGLCKDVLSALRLSGETGDALDFADDEVIMAVVTEVQVDSGFTNASLTDI